MERDRPPVPLCWASWMENRLAGPQNRIQGYSGQEDVADAVAMTALPPSVVISYSNGTKEVEWKEPKGKTRGDRRRRN